MPTNTIYYYYFDIYSVIVFLSSVSSCINILYILYFRGVMVRTDIEKSINQWLRSSSVIICNLLLLIISKLNNGVIIIDNRF
jgi:hypothetical protein